MYLLYSLLLTFGFVALLPRFLFDAVRHGKYAAGFRERMGRIAPLDEADRPVIWLHCVSVGETQAARPLVRRLLERFPSHRLVVSTVTLTGQRVAREVFAQDAVRVFYFPFDWAWTVRRSLRAINPSAVLIMETELWPRFVRECRKRLVPVAVVNGRISEKSFQRYKLIRPFIARVVDDLALSVMQTEEDAARIAALGLAPERIRVSGNVKFDVDIETGERPLTEELRGRFGLDGAQPLIVAASTHDGEERIIVEAFTLLRSDADAGGGERARLLIAPRHPERFKAVATLLEDSGLRWTRRTAGPSPTDAQADAILLDSIGELRAIYPLAALVFIGGSLSPATGGHNVLEPATYARCILTGAHTSNFAAIIRAFLEQGALLQLPPLTPEHAPSAISRLFRELLADDERRRDIGERARAALEQNRGAAERTVDMLEEVLNRNSSPRSYNLPVGVRA